MAYNSTYTGEELDALLQKIKTATVATADAAGEGGLTPETPAGSQDGSMVLKSDLTWGNMDSRYLPKGGSETYTPTGENDPATKSYVDAQVEQAVSASKLKKILVEALPNVNEADENAIYLILDSAASGQQGNVYTEHIVVTVEGVKQFEQIGQFQTSVDLSNYYTKQEANEAFQAKGDYLTKPVADGYYQPVGSYAGTAVATQSANGLMSSSDKKIVDFLTGSNTVTSLTNLPVTKRFIQATVNRAYNITVQDGMLLGQELYITVTPSASFTQNIPTTGEYRSMCGASLSITNGTPYEISILKIADSGVKYSIMAKVME